MCVTEDDDVGGIPREDGLGRRPGELVAVRNVKAHAADRHGSLARERWIVDVVDVAEHGDDAGNPLEALEHRASTDVAGVEDQLDAPEDLFNLRSPQAV